MSLTAEQHQTARRIEELGRIILAYSEVTEKLQQSHERLEQMVESLRGELSEKSRLLERKNRLAALGEMAAGLAHEIRNPLGGIQLYASLLSKDVEDRAGALELVRKISGGVRRLESLVSQVLQFSREMKANLAPCDLAEVVAHTMEMAAGRFAERRIDAQARGPASLKVRADALLLGQALLNLALNAAEASPEGGSVKLTYGASEQEGAQFHVVVEDSGQGIDPRIMDRIFNPFFTTKESGTGLGLSIVHRVVEAHDGTVQASNAAAGGGRFELRI